MKFKYIFTILIFTFSILQGDGFNTVNDNQLNMADYSIDQFKIDFINGDIFLCVNNYADWYPEGNFKDKWELNIDINSNISIVHLNKGIRHDITEQNFKKFQSSFISKNCYKFKNNFPVKFYKVKTTNSSNITFNVKSSPNGDNLQVDSDIYLFYYCYKIVKVSGKEYVLLGTDPVFDPEIDEDIRTKIIGWSLYKVDDKPVNIVLWNTNIGVRPDINDYASLKVFNSSNAAKRKSKKSSDILVSNEGVKRYITRYDEKNGQVNRWLPLYKTDYNEPNSIPVGVIEKNGEIRRDLENLVTAKEFNIVYLIDNTASMVPVWKNLYKTIDGSINSLLNDFTNIAGDSIQAKIKVFYYSDDITILNNEWIRTPSDLKKYENKIKSIKPINSKYYRPEIQNAFEYIFKELNNNPVYVVVIGDAGDHNFRQSFFDLYESKLGGNFVVVRGVRYNSESTNTEFPEAYDDFRKNFDLLFDIPRSNISDQQAETIGEQIGKSITSEYKSVIAEFPLLLTGGYSSNSGNFSSQSIFTKKYLQSVAGKLNTLGAGSFYEEGFLYTGATQNFGKDIIIDESKLRMLKQACDMYIRDNSSENFKFVLRQLCAGFFEIDFFQVTDDFLKDTDLEQFWIKVVGNRTIAERILPNLFATNKTFGEIADNSDQYLNLFNRNSQLIIENIKEHLNEPFKGKFFEVKNPYTNVIERYYWVEVETLNIFEGI